MFGEEETGTQPVKKIQEYGIEVDFQLLDGEEREDGSPEALAQFDKQIANTNTESEKMVHLEVK
jgi:structural maintenance of chromosome 1